MNKITQMNNYIKDLFTTKKWYMMFILALFSFVGFLLVGVYYIIATVFMIFDTVKVEFDSLLEKKNNDESAAVQVVKHIFAFPAVVLVKAISVVFVVVLAILYLLIVILHFVGSVGFCRSNPFALHGEH